MKFGGVLIQRTLAVELAPDSHHRYGHASAVGVTLLAFFGCAMALVATFKPEDWTMHAWVLGAGLLAWAGLAASIRFRFRKFQDGVRLVGLDLMVKDRKMLVDYASTALSLLLLMGLAIVAVAPVSMAVALLMPPLFVGAVLALTWKVHNRGVRPPVHISGQEMLEMQARVMGKQLRKRRRRDGGW